MFRRVEIKKPKKTCCYLDRIQIEKQRKLDNNFGFKVKRADNNESFSAEILTLPYLTFFL